MAHQSKRAQAGDTGSMSSEWIKSPTARRILAHWADPRPTWLWSSDGEHLLWRNSAAFAFGGKLKKHGLKPAPTPQPLRGQIARLIRLGTPNHSSLSRMQFLLGEKPLSATCACMPVALQDGQTALMVTAVDPIDPELLAEAIENTDPLSGALLPDGMEHLHVDGDGLIASGSERALEYYAPLLDGEGLPPFDDDTGQIRLGDETLTLTRRPAGDDAGFVLLIEIEAARQSDGPAAADVPDEPLLPLGLPPLPEAPKTEGADSEQWVEPLPEADQPRSLSSLFDRLADHEALYSPLTDADDVTLPAEQIGETPDAATEPEKAPGRTIEELIAEVEAAEEEAAVRAFVAEAGSEDPVPDDDPISEDLADEPVMPVAEPSDEAQAEELVAPEAPAPTLFKVVGRGFRALAEQPPAEPEPEEQAETAQSGEASAAETSPDTQATAAPDAESVERVSRYNFDELSRILTDRVSTDAPATEARPEAAPAKTSEGAQINLASETFVLNRLPLAILVFRDQQVLFANRALTELTGYEGIESLRNAGLAAIFPTAEHASETVGPVTQLLRRDGTSVSVTARLQSIPWQGRPALMLTASLAEARLGHEIAVKSFAEVFAAARQEGFISADRSGVINQVSAHARSILSRSDADLVGKPLTVLLEAQELPALKTFLERPARFAETARPCLSARGVDVGTEILLFSEGQAGIVTGYFGFARKAPIARPARPAEDAEPALLARVSRGVRRPLNTVIGFSDLIGTAAFGDIENPRYLEYARDIKAAGQEIAALVDELDDYARLKDGRYAPRPADIDLSALLESCVVRVRGQANAARVLVRSAISERLPRITADRASLGQAVLNLLASAIDQTPVGGSVVLSAQLEDDGGIAVHVRDNGAINADMSERFVVFRDGLGRDGEVLAPVRSSVGLALTRSLLAVNACSLSMDPSAGVGTLFTLMIPRELVTA